MKLTQSAVGHDLDDVAGEERAVPDGDRGALEMPAEPHQLDAVRRVPALARPELEPVRRAHHVLAVALVEQDPRVEALRPLDHRLSPTTGRCRARAARARR